MLVHDESLPRHLVTSSTASITHSLGWTMQPGWAKNIGQDNHFQSYLSVTNELEHYSSHMTETLLEHFDRLL